MPKNRSMRPEPIYQILIFAGQDYAYIIYDMHMNQIMIHPNSVVDINQEKDTKYGYQPETSGDSDGQIIIV